MMFCTKNGDVGERHRVGRGRGSSEYPNKSGDGHVDTGREKDTSRCPASTLIEKLPSAAATTPTRAPKQPFAVPVLTVECAQATAVVVLAIVIIIIVLSATVAATVAHLTGQAIVRGFDSSEQILDNEHLLRRRTPFTRQKGLRITKFLALHKNCWPATSSSPVCSRILPVRQHRPVLYPLSIPTRATNQAMHTFGQIIIYRVLL